MNPTQLFSFYIKSRNSGSKTLRYVIRQYSKQTRTTASTVPELNTSLKSENFSSFRVLFRQKRWKENILGKLTSNKLTWAVQFKLMLRQKAFLEVFNCTEMQLAPSYISMISLTDKFHRFILFQIAVGH